MYIHDCHYSSDFSASIQSLDRSDMLRSTEAFNHILQAVTRIPVVGAHYTTYNDMIANHVDPNLHTFHLLLDGTLAEGSVKNTKKAAYFLWRSLMKEWPRVKPEIELINKFIRCCLVCSDQERAFVFLAALEDCSVEPNFDTFSLLFKVYTCTCSYIHHYRNYNILSARRRKTQHTATNSRHQQREDGCSGVMYITFSFAMLYMYTVRLHV